MLRFLGALAKGCIALCLVLLTLVGIGLVVLLYKFAGPIALGFLVCVLAYVLVDEAWNAVKKHWAKS